MTNARIQKATELTSHYLDIHMLAGDHALCEAVRSVKGVVSAWNDAFHKEHDFVWISEVREEDNGTITEI
jgi:hypothetical protein